LPKFLIFPASLAIKCFSKIQVGVLSKIKTMPSTQQETNIYHLRAILTPNNLLDDALTLPMAVLGSLILPYVEQ
jgi:hypothetical protein